MGIQSLLNSGGNAIDVTILQPLASEAAGTGTGAYQTILSVTGKGFLKTFYVLSPSASFKVTIDGVVKILMATSSGSALSGLFSKEDMILSSTVVGFRKPTNDNILGVYGNVFKSFPLIDSSGGAVAVDSPIYFKNSLLLEINATSGGAYSYRYDGGS
ncbi:MAG: hypothetical protein JWM44_2495 [Bacilli bacterium]|nr:hypothetical protein [Bacilli bacterium]